MSEIIWISHRGYCADAVENSRAAFDASIEAGFSYLETDLRCSADGGLVLSHDSSTKRSFGFDMMVEQSTFDKLKALGLFTFEEFIERYAAYSWTFDMKPESAERSLKVLKDWMQKRNAEAWLNHHARFLLWDAGHAALAKTLFPGLVQLARERECYRAGLSVLGRVPFLGGIQKGKTYNLPRFFAGQDLFNKKLVSAYHARGAKLCAYLPKTAEDARAAIEAGYDEILTNHLPLK